MIPFRVLKGLKANLPTAITDGTIYVCIDTDEVFVDNVYNRIQLSNVQPNWAQTDETKVDYIKNKPELGNLAAKNTVEKSDLSTSVQTSLDNANTALTSIDELSVGVAYIDEVDNEDVESEIESAKDELKEYLSIELAKRGQLKPEFANSVDECTDTTKLYVLPDGYIYANMSVTGERNEYTNLADPSSADWLTDKRFSTSSISDATGGIITNYISCKKGDVVRVKGLDVTTTLGGSRPRIRTYKGTTVVDGGGFNAHMLVNNNNNGSGISGDISTLILTEGENTITNGELNVGFDRIRLNGVLMSGYTADDVIITVNEEIKTVSGTTQTWMNTGHAFVPANYEDRIIVLEAKTETHESKLRLLEVSADGLEVPSYWLDELDTKAEAIQQAMETAGRNKSAFLWYTDAHWTNSSKMSPMLLKYLANNTPMNKVNFGGDIVGDPSPYNHDNVNYVYEWRKLIADLPNHHSVYGNHDVNHRNTDVGNIAYALVLASEESSDMVVGGDSYYYIDNPSEKTRYLYLSYFVNNTDDKISQCNFIVDALTSVKDGWHIVAIAHRWHQYTTTSAPTAGSVPAYEAEILQVFDEYNARTSHAKSTFFESQSFADAKGKVEFCIGGHIHVDYDFTSNGGIPVIITAPDTNQERAPEETEDSGTKGTITESAVFGIIADYNNNKITVVGVGRGTSRVIDY